MGFILGSSPNQPGVIFATGNETFEWNSQAIQNALRVSGILSMWVDASNVATGKFLTINTGYQTFQVEGGTQGYIIITAPLPLNLVITTNNGAGVTIPIILYNYNVFFTGSVAVAGAGGGGTPVEQGQGGVQHPIGGLPR